jgi:hypothetical protein
MDDSEKTPTRTTLQVQFISHFFRVMESFIFLTESGNNMPRSQRQLLDEPADERSFLFYVPSQEVYDHKNVGFFGSFE